MSRFGNYFPITRWGIGKVGEKVTFSPLKCATNQNWDGRSQIGA